MTRTFITEPNFTSIYREARSGVPAELVILLTVFLGPMDPTKPYHAVRSAGPLLFQQMLPAFAHLAWPDEANLNFHTHLANSPGDIRRGTITDGDGGRFRARSWTAQEFDRYKVKFKQVVELSWNNQIILLPPEDPKDGLNDDQYMDLVSDPRLPAHLVCTLNIFLTDNPDSANATIQVARLDRDEDQFDQRDRLMPLPGEEEFRSYAYMITNEDVYRRRSTSYRWPYVRMSQIAAAHEVGHWLGRPTALGSLDRYLAHIDGDNVAKTDPNYDELQYGKTAGHAAALMGLGSLATIYEAGPWMTRARRHTRALFGWRFVHRSQFVGMVPVSDRQKRLTAPAPAHP
jgi:hypothetical protein